MIRTAWASAPLSFLIVVAAAVILFEPEPITGGQTVVDPRLQDPVVADPEVLPLHSTTKAEAEVVSSNPLAFAIVGPLGESLAEVALRVYGSPDAVAVLWEANRDLVNDPEAPLPPGTMLRTP